MIGKWNHNILLRSTSSPRCSTRRTTSSFGSTRVTTAAAPQSRMASRSRERSRSQYPLIACRSYLPGQKVMPTRPKVGPADKDAISNGCVRDVLFILDPRHSDGNRPLSSRSRAETVAGGRGARTTIARRAAVPPPQVSGFANCRSCAGSSLSRAVASAPGCQRAGRALVGRHRRSAAKAHHAISNSSAACIVSTGSEGAGRKASR